MLIYKVQPERPWPQICVSFKFKFPSVLGPGSSNLDHSQFEDVNFKSQIEGLELKGALKKKSLKFSL